MFKRLKPSYLRNILFGAEDSLVSTVGFLFGLATSADYTTKLLILAGVVLITVEALSMGVGAYLTETEVLEYEGNKEIYSGPIIGGILMFFSYLMFGSAVLSPYALLPLESAKFLSVICTLVLLFIIGYLPTKKAKTGFRMLIMAGLAILVGFLVAKIF